MFSRAAQRRPRCRTPSWTRFSLGLHQKRRPFFGQCIFRGTTHHRLYVRVGLLTQASHKCVHSFRFGKCSSNGRNKHLIQARGLHCGWDKTVLAPLSGGPVAENFADASTCIFRLLNHGGRSLYVGSRERDFFTGKREPPGMRRLPGLRDFS